MAFAPDGHTLATSENDGSVLLWDITSRENISQLGSKLYGGWMVENLAFMPDRRTLAVGSADSVGLWDMVHFNDFRDHPAKYACAITGRGLDRGEWYRYISGLPYQETCPR